jgi:hypothetical protein
MFRRLRIEGGGVQAEFAGKMSFYLSAIDDLLRHPEDRPSIGIILCRDRNEVVVEYALRDSGKPMGVAQYRTSTALPEQLMDELPTAEDLAAVMTDRDGGESRHASPPIARTRSTAPS